MCAATTRRRTRKMRTKCYMISLQLSCVPLDTRNGSGAIANTAHDRLARGSDAGRSGLSIARSIATLFRSFAIDKFPCRAASTQPHGGRSFSIQRFFAAALLGRQRHTLRNGMNATNATRMSPAKFKWQTEQNRGERSRASLTWHSLGAHNLNIKLSERSKNAGHAADLLSGMRSSAVRRP